MASTKKVLKQKIKKKKWYPIYAPKTFNTTFVGETYLDSVENLKGKYVSANLSTIVNDMKKQHISITLRVNKVVDGAGHTELIGMKILQGYLKRLLRRGRTKVEDSFAVKTKDDVLIRIKPVIITSSACNRPVSTEVRVQTKKYLTELIQSQGFIATFEDILNFRVQKALKQNLGKTTPIRSVDIRIFERETVRGAVPEQELSEEIPKREPLPPKKVAMKPSEIVEEDAERNAPDEPDAESAPAKKETQAAASDEDDDSEEEE